ncbi:hypothetical protein [Actinacidiphila paucisporea]|uniref:Uncharacterized protein n=1 Tax=Actinacidiphila paucisporea TaxID=310782 RepID=A0A1M7PH93_9ACTN|nr:hypothetical protein [Actinacidiphila paucisporea]SHN16433.1 hypothetical protein SAMN05216499_12389 [Actinacidiphila paucisporea]
MADEPGRIFREAWISGVRKHFAGEPTPGYVAGSEDLPGWQRETDADIFEAVRDSL